MPGYRGHRCQHGAHACSSLAHTTEVQQLRDRRSRNVAVPFTSPHRTEDPWKPQNTQDKRAVCSASTATQCPHFISHVLRTRQTCLLNLPTVQFKHLLWNCLHVFQCWIAECPEGYYGEGCAEKCMCMHGAACDPEIGACICKAGWRGRLCGKGTHASPTPLLKTRVSQEMVLLLEGSCTPAAFCEPLNMCSSRFPRTGLRITQGKPKSPDFKRNLNISIAIRIVGSLNESNTCCVNRGEVLYPLIFNCARQRFQS